MAFHNFRYSLNNLYGLGVVAGLNERYSNKGASFITRIHTKQDHLYPYSVNKLIVGLGLELNNIRVQERSNNNQQEKTPKNDDDIYTLQDGAKNNVHQVHHVHLS